MSGRLWSRLLGGCRSRPLRVPELSLTGAENIFCTSTGVASVTRKRLFTQNLVTWTPVW
jgi:hypothetical protein